jgi:protoporphyrinogen oxidase
MTAGERPSFVVLGAGPAGLAAAFKLASRGSAVTVLERNAHVGGNAASVVIDGIPVDFGSHRLHPSCPPDVLADIRSLLGNDLLDRPRHGRIRLRGRWVHFPLEPVDLVRHLPPAFVLGVAADAIGKPFARQPAEATFASVLERGLGRTICRDFYFPYARKIWGLPPDALDAEQARRRVSSGSLGGMVRRVLGAVPGLRRPGRGRFFYPRGGFGQISEVFARAARDAGARIWLEAAVTSVDAQDGRVRQVVANIQGSPVAFPATHVLSTIPLTALARLVRTGDGQAPPDGRLEQRAMVLVYLTLDADRFTEFDAHYFPETRIRITRLSESKNYSQTTRAGRTVICAELPCSHADPEWTSGDDTLQALVLRDLHEAGLGPLPAVLSVRVMRLPHAYPVYAQGYRQSFEALDRWVDAIDGLITFGRQGLFVHDNTHHTMAMAYALAACLDDRGGFDRRRWAAARQAFDTHVVED